MRFDSHAKRNNIIFGHISQCPGRQNFLSFSNVITEPCGIFGNYIKAAIPDFFIYLELYMQIPIVRNILEANEKLANEIRSDLSARHILSLNLISSPGAGKTSLLEKTLSGLAGKYNMAVVEGDLQTDNDARRVAATGAQAVQINTEGGCHLNSNLVRAAIDNINLDNLDILFIENVGNLVCPVEFDCGEDAKVAILSVTEGDDKPEKYPLLFHLAKAMVLNKIDLLPYVDFDVQKACALARKLNADLEIFEVSCRTGQGLEQWFAWLEKMRADKAAH